MLLSEYLKKAGVKDSKYLAKVKDVDQTRKFSRDAESFKNGDIVKFKKDYIFDSSYRGEWEVIAGPEIGERDMIRLQNAKGKVMFTRQFRITKV